VKAEIYCINRCATTNYYFMKNLTPDPSPVERGALGAKKPPLCRRGGWG